MNSCVNKMTIITAIAYTLTFIFISQCFAGAWTQDECKVYEKFGFNYYYANREFSMQDDSTDFDHFRDANFSNYIEYGITDRFTLINALYYKNLEKEDGSGTTRASGLGDVDLGLKAKLFEGKWGIASSQLLVKIPGIYGKNDALPLGNAQYDLEPRLLYGRSLYPYIPGYCNFELAYRWRFQDPADEFRYLVEFGIDFSKKFYGRVKLDGILSMDNGSPYATSNNPSATNSYDLGKLEVALGYKINERWGLELAYTPEIYGRNTTAGATYGIAVTYQNKIFLGGF